MGSDGTASPRGRFTPAQVARQTEYDRLFLAANAELALILRHYLRAGTVMDRPLPCVEVLVIDGKLHAETSDQANANEELTDTRREAGFLRTIG